VTGGGGDLSALRGREWDAVLDTFNGPEPVAAMARLLSGVVGAGLRLRPSPDTARDTLSWLLSRQQGAGLETGFSPEFERELLEGWHASSVNARPESG